MERRIGHVQSVLGSVGGHVGYSIRRPLDTDVRIYESAELRESLALDPNGELKLLAFVDMRLKRPRPDELNGCPFAIL